MAKLTLDFTKIANVTLEFNRSMADTDGKFVEMDIIIHGKSAGAPLHYHPYSEEIFEVKEGSCELFCFGKWQVLQQGYNITVPKGMIHGFRKKDNARAVVMTRLTPPSDYEKYLSMVAQLINSGKIKPKMNLKFFIYHAIVRTRYNQSTQFKGVMMSGMIGMLSRIGKLLGYKLPEAE